MVSIREMTIARIWRGWTSSADADAYLDYVQRTGIVAYRTTPGNLGASVLRRDLGDRTEFVTISFWESMDAVRAFAGDKPERAVFYPEDDRYLVEREATVTHFEAFDAPAPDSRDRGTGSQEPPR
jgi:heme-degrading monooxygenase HmoA